MSTIRIGTLNVQNNKTNRTGGINSSGSDNTEILGNFIENNDFYFLGAQEIVRVFSKKLLSKSNRYKIYGGYRYGDSKLVQKVGFLNDFNESNPIITKGKVLTTKTNLLPWFPNNPIDLFKAIKHGSIMPRIITSAEIEDNEVGKITILNTHLDYQLESVQKRQLKSILKMIKIIIKENPNIVLTGDFNMELNVDSHFDEFINELDKLGLKRVEINNKTNAEKFVNKTAIDHIFIPKKWIIEKAGIIDDENLKSVTDHKGIYADVKIR